MMVNMSKMGLIFTSLPISSWLKPMMVSTFIFVQSWAMAAEPQFASPMDQISVRGTTFNNPAGDVTLNNPWDQARINNSMDYDTAVITLRKSVMEWGKANDISEISRKMGWSKQCNAFTKGEEYGIWARYIYENISKNSYSRFLDAPFDLVAACPDFPFLTFDLKMDVWILIINAMAHFESSCDSKVGAVGPNGKLAGLLQLHVGKEEFYSPPCSRGDSKNPRDTFDCAIGMLNDQMIRSGRLFDPKSYWDVLRPQSTNRKAIKIYKAITEFPLCGFKNPILGKEYYKKK